MSKYVRIGWLLKKLFIDTTNTDRLSNVEKIGCINRQFDD